MNAHRRASKEARRTCSAAQLAFISGKLRRNDSAVWVPPFANRRAPTFFSSRNSGEMPKGWDRKSSGGSKDSGAIAPGYISPVNPVAADVCPLQASSKELEPAQMRRHHQKPEGRTPSGNSLPDVGVRREDGPALPYRAALTGESGFGCAFSHSSRETVFFSCRCTNVPFLFPTTISGRPSPFRSLATTCTPTPESLSMR